VCLLFFPTALRDYGSATARRERTVSELRVGGRVCRNAWDVRERTGGAQDASANLPNTNCRNGTMTA
jgi:hypothetical protein